MKNKKILKNGLVYKSKVTGENFTLNEDYNGLWYLDNRNEIGYKKTLSLPEYAMAANLMAHYEIVKKEENS